VAHPYRIREIAVQAALSERTVDRVLNNRGGVRTSTAGEVRQAIATCCAAAGYQPSCSTISIKTCVRPVTPSCRRTTRSPEPCTPGPRHPRHHAVQHARSCPLEALTDLDTELTRAVISTHSLGSRITSAVSVERSAA
jgi:Bacterial regulatory proteins, lacI family